MTNSATRQSARASRNSRVYPASHRALAPTPFDASLHASQPSSAPWCPARIPDAPSRRRAWRTPEVRRTRVAGARREDRGRFRDTPDDPVRPPPSRRVFFLTRSLANPRAPLTRARPRPRNTRGRSVLDLPGRCEAEPAEAVPVPALGTSSPVLSHAVALSCHRRLFPKRETDETLERVLGRDEIFTRD